MLKATKRHPWRPAHLHFMIKAPGYETLITHVFRNGDQYLDSDAVFGVRQSLVADWVKQPDGKYLVEYDFVLNPREGRALIRHIVMWNVRGASREEKEPTSSSCGAASTACAAACPGLLHLEIGVDHSRVDYACDVVLYSEFESQAALDAYATHPEHLRVKQEIGDMRIARHQVDYRVE
jgi:hypothetical protein